MAAALNNPVPCNICEDQVAKFHCNTCGDALCQTCKTYHLKSRATRDHDIVPYAKKLNPKFLVGLLCHTHKTDGPEYWCDTCSAPICGPCIIKEHKGHQISSITTILSQKRDAMLEDMKGLRDETVGKWAEVLKDAKKITTDFLGRIDEIDQELAYRAKAMHKQVDAIHTASKQTLQDMRMSGLTKLQDQEKYVGDKLQQLKDDVKRYEDQLNYGDPTALLQYREGTIQSQGIEKPPCLDKATVPVFTKGQDDAKSMEKIFGQFSRQTLQQKSTSHNSTKLVNPSESGKARKTSSKSNTNNNAAQRSLLPNPSVMSLFRVEVNIPCIACVDQGLAWVRTTDKTLQLVDRTGAVKDTINTDFNIFDIALTFDSDLLLADYKNNCIKSVSWQKTVTTLFRTSEAPLGLCCLPNDDIVVTFPHDSKVTVYGRDGKSRRTLNHIRFRHPMRVAVNKVNQDIYICDQEHLGYGNPGKLLAVGADGRLRYEYTGQSDSKFTPAEVCSDQMGHILIADHANNQVHILNQEGWFIRYVLTVQQGLNYPTTIDVDREGYVWVGELVENGGYVKVARYLQ